MVHPGCRRLLTTEGFVRPLRSQSECVRIGPREPVDPSFDTTPYFFSEHWRPQETSNSCSQRLALFWSSVERISQGPPSSLAAAVYQWRLGQVMETGRKLFHAGCSWRMMVSTHRKICRKARGLTTKFMFGNFRQCLSDERRHRLDSWNSKSWPRYTGELRFNVLYVMTASLNSIRCLIGSQCQDDKYR